MTYTELQRNYGIEFEERSLPDFEEINRLQAERVAGELLQVARDTEITSFLRLADHLKATEAGTEVIAYLLKQHFAALEEERAKMPAEIGRPSRAADEDDRDDRKRKKKKKKKRFDDEAEFALDEVASEAEPDDEQVDVDAPAKPAPRPKKRPAPRREASAPAALPPPEPASHPAERARLFINRGSSDEYDETMLAQLVVESAGSGTVEDVGRVQLRKTHAFVEVTPELADAAVAAAQRGLEREERPVAIERARTR